MKPKNIMEIVFIFILPLLFILPCISINKEFVYDNEGNFESSELSVDYQQNLFQDTYQEEQYIGFVHYVFYNEDYLDTYYELTGTIYINQNLDGTIYYSEGSYDNDYLEQIIYFDSRNNTLDDGINDTIYSSGTEVINNNTYYIFTLNNYKIYCLSVSVDEGYYEKVYQTVTKNTPWKSIKDLVVDNLYLNDTVVVDIIIDYTILWFVMFILWHFFYLFFDMLVHLFIDWKKR